MPKLPDALVLLRESWFFFRVTWTESLKLSIWFLYAGLVEFGLGILQKFAPSVASIVSIPIEVIVWAFVYWSSLRLTRSLLDLEAGKKLDLSREASIKAWQLCLPNLWIGILQGLIVLGGLVLLLVPGIYLFVALAFSQLIFIDQGVRGLRAIKTSYELVKTRWWPTLWRQIVLGGVFGISAAAITAIIVSLVLRFVGAESASAVEEDPLLQGVLNLVSAMMQTVALPLFIGAEVKLYRALQKSL